MNIKMRPDFRDGRDVPSMFDARDPRAANFHEDQVIVDLRDCLFVYPAAALWCLTYLLLAQRKTVRTELWVPQNMGVCAYLSSLGLFETLKTTGVIVDDRAVPRGGEGRIILPLRNSARSSKLTSLSTLHTNGSRSLAWATLTFIVSSPRTSVNAR